MNPKEAFNLFKKEVLSKGPDNFVNSPASYPNKGNDYEFVSHCGANKDKTQVFFTQGKNTWTLVCLGASNKDESLTQYADGAWQVVYGMGLCE